MSNVETKQWQSFAQWPIEMGTGYELVTIDKHDTREQAEAVCQMLERDGLGGQREQFPVRTWVEPIAAGD